MTVVELVLLAPFVPLGFTALNLLTWRRPRPAAASLRMVVCVPARNEAENIGACLVALRATRASAILVYDDGSTDDTAQIVTRAAAEDGRISLLHGHGPPAGWLGKTHACHQLARAAGKRADVLAFVDADVQVAADFCEQVEAGLEGVDVMTALPRQRTSSLGEALIVPLLHLTYTSWLPLALIPWVPWPTVLAANGQIVAIRRAAYEDTGGFSTVREAVVDDMALCRMFKARGYPVRFCDGHLMGTCRMYRSGREAVDGFCKNVYPGLGSSPWVLSLVLALYTLCFLLPWAALPLAPTLALPGVIANLLQRALLAAHHRTSWLSVPLHPLTVVLFKGIAVRSAYWSYSGAAHWKGRGIPKPYRAARLATRLLQRYARWRIGADLDGLWARGVDEVRAELARGPVVLACNHVGWWDGIVLVATSYLFGAESRVLVGAEGVRKLPFIRWIGAIPLEPGVRGRAGLAEAIAHLSGPNRILWVFPQGRQRPSGVRPLAFRPGFEWLARRTGAAVVPVALDYVFRHREVPSAVLSFGAATSPEAVEAAVTGGLDQIRLWADAHDGGGPLPEGFRLLLGKRDAPVNGGAGAILLNRLHGGSRA